MSCDYKAELGKMMMLSQNCFVVIVKEISGQD